MTRAPLVPRRQLLAGTAGVVGLLVGAGAGAGITAAADDDPAPRGAAAPSPGEELMVEHGVLKRLLLAYREIDARLDDGRTVPAGVLGDTAQLIAGYVEDFHEGLEEAYVFPRVRAAEPDLVHTLLIQHDRGRHLTAAIAAAADADLTRADARAGIRRYLRGFVRMYEPHEAWEDTVIYPTLRRVSSQRTLDQLAERFRELQADQWDDDTLAHVLAQVEAVERKLGIDDLAALTWQP